MALTPEQRAAVDIHDRNLIVTAGAGSGKTRVLVERFIALLDTHPDWALPSVVAITFTEKAAAEMLSRVRAAIDERIQAADQSGDAGTLERWRDHRTALARARIGTIHGLCAAILRANAAEAGIDPDFDVLDENEAALVLDDAVETALVRLGSEDRPGAGVLAAYDLSRVRVALREHAWRGTASAVARDLDRATPGSLLARWESKWADAAEDIMRTARSDANLRAALDWIDAGALPPGDKLSDVWRVVFDQVDPLLSADPEQFAAAVDALADGIKLNVGAAKTWGGADGLAESKAALKLIRERAQALQQSMLPRPGDLDAQAAALLLSWRDAVALVAQVYDDLKGERGALDFDDLEARARELLDDHPAAVLPYADPVNGEFRHILVDEFQDTNDAQRAILYRLAGIGGLSADGRLFVVGDPKQSVYAFRGADVSVFAAVRDDLRSLGGEELPLSTSFRAHAGLVDAFNDLFGRILIPGRGTAARYEVERGVPMGAVRAAEAGDAPTLTVIGICKPDGEISGFAGRRFDGDELRRWEAWEVAQHVRGLVEHGTLVWDREDQVYRPAQYGDVALLFQAMTLAPLYEDVFKAAGLPYVTIAGRGYFDRPEVWDLLNLLAALRTPADDLALAVVLRSPLFGLSDDALYALRLAEDGAGAVLPLAEALCTPDAAPLFPDDEAGARDFAGGVLAELRDLAGRATVAEVLARALDLTGYLAALTGLPGGARRRGNVEKLLALARQSGRIALGAFLDYARDLTAREVREGEAAVETENAVKLMSVHASKGLEFPIVALMDASRGLRRSVSAVLLHDPDAGTVCLLPDDDPASATGDKRPQPFAYQLAAQFAERRDQAERRRLLYVGATRAADLLIVSGQIGGRTFKGSWLAQWLDALGATEADLLPSGQPQVLPFEWGRCALVVPQTPPPRAVLLPRVSGDSAAWDAPDLAAGQPFAGVDPVWLRLLAPITRDPLIPARALSAAHLEKLGQAPYWDPADRGRAVFRNALLHDAPEPLYRLPDRPLENRDQRRIVGEIVHRALRLGLLPGRLDAADLQARLDAYGWEAGLTDADQLAAAVARAVDLLRRYEASDVCGEIERAQQVYREIPFVHETRGHVFNGVIDVLYFLKDRWCILDYKTARVRWAEARENAPRYYLQLGVYAEAVAARTGQEPHAALYYIHPGRQITVRAEDWRAALDALDDDLRAALAYPVG